MGVIHKISPDNGTTQYLIRDDSIAPVELTTTASQAYSVGDQFILNDGKIYKATADIAQGGTITAGTNCEEAGTVSEQLNGKQDTLTIDNTPTKNSPNVVKSGGVFDAIDDVYGVMGENGAKNILALPISRIKALNTGGTWTGNVYERNGATFTFTVDSNGNVTEVDVDSNGSQTSDNNYLTFLDYGEYTIPEGSFILSDVNGSADCYSYVARKLNSGSANYGVTTINGEKEFTVDYTEYNNFQFAIAALKNKVFNHVKLKIMIRDARDTNPTYQPHAMTNAELTDAVKGWTDRVTIPTVDCASYGNLYFSENVGMHLACLWWVGNSSAPSSNITEEINISSYATEKPLTETANVMRNGDILLVSATNYARVGIKTSAWSGGSLLYPTVPK